MSTTSFVTAPAGEVHFAVAPTAFGEFTVVGDDAALISVNFAGAESDGSWGSPVDLADHPVLRAAATQLAEFFSGERRAFDLPLRPGGTEFQQAAWTALLAIPYGETRTYGEQARILGRPSASRAVGGANNRNPIPVIIPCHRVVGSTGALTGYAGGMDLKARLLDLESGQATLS